MQNNAKKRAIAPKVLSDKPFVMGITNQDSINKLFAMSSKVSVDKVAVPAVTDAADDDDDVIITNVVPPASIKATKPKQKTKAEKEAKKKEEEEKKKEEKNQACINADLEFRQVPPCSACGVPPIDLGGAFVKKCDCYFDKAKGLLVKKSNPEEEEAERWRQRTADIQKQLQEQLEAKLQEKLQQEEEERKKRAEEEKRKREEEEEKKEEATEDRQRKRQKEEEAALRVSVNALKETQEAKERRLQEFCSGVPQLSGRDLGKWCNAHLSCYLAMGTWKEARPRLIEVCGQGFINYHEARLDKWWRNQRNQGNSYNRAIAKGGAEQEKEFKETLVVDPTGVVKPLEQFVVSKKIGQYHKVIGKRRLRPIQRDVKRMQGDMESLKKELARFHTDPPKWGKKNLRVYGELQEKFSEFCSEVRNDFHRSEPGNLVAEMKNAVARAIEAEERAEAAEKKAREAEARIFYIQMEMLQMKKDFEESISKLTTRINGVQYDMKPVLTAFNNAKGVHLKKMASKEKEEEEKE